MFFQGKFHEFHPGLEISSTDALPWWQSLQCKLCFFNRMLAKNEQNTVSKKQFLNRPCATKTLVYLEFQPQGEYFRSSNFPKSFCPIRLNRTPARNIYYKHIDYLCISRFFKYIYIYVYLGLCHCSQVFLFLYLAARQISCVYMKLIASHDFL